MKITRAATPPELIPLEELEVLRINKNRISNHLDNDIYLFCYSLQQPSRLADGSDAGTDLRETGGNLNWYALHNGLIFQSVGPENMHWFQHKTPKK
jgi:hypothetical protein